MAAYKKFARWYDRFMADIPYGEWAEYVIGQLKRYGIEPDAADNGAEDLGGNVVLELGCGTGSMARYLCMEGYRVVGIDLSPDMIKEADRKLIPGFEAYVGDMRVPFLENESCAGIISVCDSMNYLTAKSDVELTIKAAAMQLKSGGVFIFDMKTDRFYREELADNAFTDRAGSISYVWENHYDERTHVNTYDITFYRRLIGGLCLSYRERHRQRAYSRTFIEKTARSFGFELCDYKVKDERAYYTLRKR